MQCVVVVHVGPAEMVGTGKQQVYKGGRKRRESRGRVWLLLLLCSAKACIKSLFWGGPRGHFSMLKPTFSPQLLCTGWPKRNAPPLRGFRHISRLCWRVTLSFNELITKSWEIRLNHGGGAFLLGHPYVRTERRPVRKAMT